MSTEQAGTDGPTDSKNTTTAIDNNSQNCV